MTYTHESKFNSYSEPGCGIIDSCRNKHCLCRICVVAPWCGTDCKNCVDNNYGERKVKCLDFYPDKYMINHMRQLEEENELIMSDRMELKALQTTMEGDAVT